MSDPVPLPQIANWLRDEAAHYDDPRNVRWATEAAATLESLHAAATELLAQYDAVPNFTLGGKLTNKPFLAIRELLS